MPNVCARPVCRDGWCYENPHPQPNDLFGVAATPHGLWTLGARGTALRSTGGSFARVTAFTRVPSNLHDILATGPDDAWAVGTRGALLRFDGSILICTRPDDTHWSPVTKDLFAIAVGTDGAPWVVGEETVLRLEGDAWTVDHTFDGTLRDVEVTHDGTVWAVGQDGATKPLVMAHRGGWEEIALPAFDGVLEGLTRLDDDSLLAVGTRRAGGQDHPIVLSGSEAGWQEVPVAGGDEPGGFRTVASWEGEIWAVGDDGLVAFGPAGGPMARLPKLFGDVHLTSLARDDEGLVLVGQHGLVAKYRSGFWEPSVTRVPPIVPGAEPVMWARDDHDVWAGGDRWVMRWTGVRWNVAYVPAKVRGFFSASRGSVWAIGQRVENGAEEGVVLHHDGQRWQEALVRPGVFVGIEGTSTTDIRVRTHDGAIHWFDGAGWTEREEEDFPVGGSSGGVNEAEWSIGGQAGFVRDDGGEVRSTTIWPFDGLQGTPLSSFAASSDEVWAVGEDGIVHRTDEGWAKVLSDVEVRSVHGSGASNVWFAGKRVGSDGPVWRWDGLGLESWAVQPDEDVLHAVSVASDGTVACAGEKLHRWAGSAWESEELPGSGPIRALWAWSPEDIWAARGASLLHLEGGAWNVIDPYEKLDRKPTTGAASMEVHRIFGITPDQMLFAGITPDRLAAILLGRSSDAWGNGYLQSISGEATFLGLWAQGLEDAWVTMGEIGWVYHYRHSVRMFDVVEAVSVQPLHTLTGHGNRRWVHGTHGLVALWED